MKIGFIGIGKMGLPMAGHLHAAGHDVTVFDNVPAQGAAARTAGMRIADSLPRAVADADAVFSSLPHDAAFDAVAQAVSQCARPDSLYIDTSTVSLAASARAAAAFQRAGGDYLRVTVSGNNKMAEAAQLTAMVSGPRAAFERALPLLKLLGPAQFYLGDGEQARLMKLVVNLMIAVTSGMLGEALALGQKGGLDWRDMWSVIAASAVGSPIVKAKAVQLSEHDFSPTFTVDQMLKDVGLILDAGAQLRVPLALTSQVGQLLQGAAALGVANEDYSAVIKAVQAAAGLPVQRMA